MKIRFILVTVACAALLSGCDLFGVGVVSTSTYNEAVAAKEQAEEVARAAKDAQAKAEKALDLLKKNPPTQTVAGITEAACTTIVTNAVANACRPPAAKVIYKEKLVIAPAIVQRPVVEQARPVAQERPRQDLNSSVDRCVFRIDGVVRAEANLHNGAVTCPVWRDEMLAYYKKNPNDKIWERSYPSK